jgi:peptidoglycan/LPS O-acetylase OafA/YrhL
MAICVINIYFIGSSILIVLSLSMYCYLFIAGINFYKIWAQEGGIKNHIQILVCFLFSILTQPFLESFFVLLFFALFYLFIYRKLEFITRIKFLVFLGVVSYPFYLIHQFLGMIIIYYTRQYISTNFIVLLVAPLIITIAIAFLINRYFEEWATLKFKKILFPKQ